MKGEGVTRRQLDHLLKRHDVLGRGNDDDDGDLPDSAMLAEQKLEEVTAYPKSPQVLEGLCNLSLS